MRETRQTIWQNFIKEPSTVTFGPVYEQSKSLVWTICYRILRNDDDCKDAFQSTYCRFLTEVRNGCPALPEIASDRDAQQLLYHLAVREAQNLRQRCARRANRETTMDHLDEVPGSQPRADAVVSQSQIRAKIDALVMLLPDEFRVPLELQYFQGIAQEEIAQMLGVSQSTTSRRISRGLSRLKKMMERAGLASAMESLVALGFSSPLLDPPATLSSEMVYAHIESVIVAGSSAALGGGSTAVIGKISLGTLIMQTKLGVITGVLILSIGALMAGKQIIGYDDGANKKQQGRTGGQLRIKEVGFTSPTASPEKNYEGPSPFTSGTAEMVSGQANSSRQTVTKRAPSLQSPSKSTDTGILMGRLIDAETKKPIAGGTVRTGKGLSGSSDSHGVYTIKGIKPGKIFVTATVSGYEDKELTIGVSKAGQTIQDFVLEPAVDVNVLVKDEQGRAVEGADISLLKRMDGPNGTTFAIVTFQGKTDAQGHAVVPKVSRITKPDILADKEGYKKAETKSGKLIINPQKTQGTITLLLPTVKDNVRVIQGKITDRQGKPLPLITVQWAQFRGSRTGRDKTISDENGLYRLEFRNEETVCKLSAFGKGWAPVIEHYLETGTPEHPAEKNFIMDPGHWLEGEVVTEKGEPVQGARIHVDPSPMIPDLGAFPCVKREIESDAAGKFSLKDLTGPLVEINVRGTQKKSFSAYNNERLLVDQRIRVVLKDAGVITGRVVDKESGKPVSLFMIKINGSLYSSDSFNSAQAFESSNGQFTIRQLDQGAKHLLIVEASGYITAQVNDVIAGPEGEAKEHIIRISRGREIRGYVVDGVKKGPLKDVKVAFEVNDHRNFDWAMIGSMKSRGNGQTVVTAANGQFRFLEDEAGTLFFQAPGYRRLVIRPKDRSRYQPGKDWLWIPLMRGEAIQGTVYEHGRSMKPSNSIFLCRLNDVPINRLASSEFYGIIEVEDDGKFERDDLSPGKYSIYSFRDVDADEYRQYTIIRDFELSEGETKSINFGDDLGPFTLSGRLLDEQSTPLDDVMLSLQPAFTWSYSEFQAWNTTENGGRFTIQGLRPGRYKLAVIKGNGKEQEQVPLPTIEITGNVDRDISLPATMLK